MTTLALEFSSERRSVAVAATGVLRSEMTYEGTVRTPIFRLIESVLDQAGLGRHDIECLAVGLGPGSYTGVRLAISVAQGWQLAAGTATIGVGSLENLARAAGPERTWLAVDAQRGEFAAVEAVEGRLLGKPRLVSAEELRRQLAAGARVAGPGIVRALGGGRELAPTAAIAAALAAEGVAPVPAEGLVPVYLREAVFVKAPPAREGLGEGLGAGS